MQSFNLITLGSTEKYEFSEICLAKNPEYNYGSHEDKLSLSLNRLGLPSLLFEEYYTVKRIFLIFSPLGFDTMY